MTFNALSYVQENLYPHYKFEATTDVDGTMHMTVTYMPFRKYKEEADKDMVFLYTKTGAKFTFDELSSIVKHCLTALIINREISGVILTNPWDVEAYHCKNLEESACMDNSPESRKLVLDAVEDRLASKKVDATPQGAEQDFDCKTNNVKNTVGIVTGPPKRIDAMTFIKKRLCLYHGLQQNDDGKVIGALSPFGPLTIVDLDAVYVYNDKEFSLEELGTRVLTVIYMHGAASSYFDLYNKAYHTCVQKLTFGPLEHTRLNAIACMVTRDLLNDPAFDMWMENELELEHDRLDEAEKKLQENIDSVTNPQDAVSFTLKNCRPVWSGKESGGVICLTIDPFAGINYPFGGPRFTLHGETLTFGELSTCVAYSIIQFIRNTPECFNAIREKIFPTSRILFCDPETAYQIGCNMTDILERYRMNGSLRDYMIFNLKPVTRTDFVRVNGAFISELHR